MSQLSFGQELGAGGAGTVYEGTWQGQRVAIKKLPGRFTRAADQEMQLISKLRHDNVVRYFTVEKSNTSVCLVMELILGGTVFDFIQREFEQTNYWATTHRILQDISIGMNYLHEQNIIHGDLKSHNILLRKNTNQAVICDFGLSKTLTTAQSHITKKASVVQGKYWYLLTCNRNHLL
jgi:serine/threonine protein kinase